VTGADLALVRVSAAVGRRDEALLESELAQAMAVTVSARIEEVLLQSYLFVGFPATLEAFRVWRRLSPAVPAPRVEDMERWRDRGARVCAVVYGSQFGSLLDSVAALQPELGEWMLQEGYGKVLGRDGLELRVRELCIVALLVAQPSPRQLYSHLRGALHAGASVADVEEALAVTAEGLDAALAASAFQVWREVRDRRAVTGDVEE
jgi:4-carboxymuconolactone decarboxylase